MQIFDCRFIFLNWLLIISILAQSVVEARGSLIFAATVIIFRGFDWLISLLTPGCAGLRRRIQAGIKIGIIHIRRLFILASQR